MTAYFVAGTDTEIGKTFVTCTLLHAARNRGLTAIGMKPIAAGAETVNGEFINEDAARLRAAGSFDPGLALLNPYCLTSPIAPHIAAAEEGVRIDAGRIRLHMTAPPGTRIEETAALVARAGVLALCVSAAACTIGPDARLFALSPASRLASIGLFGAGALVLAEVGLAAPSAPPVGWIGVLPPPEPYCTFLYLPG